MKTIHINCSKQYDVLIGKGLLDNLPEYIKRVKSACKCVVVTDSNVAPLYLEKVKTVLSNGGFDVSTFIFESGEKQKNYQTLFDILNFFAQCELQRNDIAIALGGGVVGDICGLAAAIFKRGIDYIQLPTTLLAAVDSSVGGKTAIDIEAGKNLVGAFHQPKMVICDYQTFDTLPKEVFQSGMCEVIKYAFISDCDFYEKLLDKTIDIEEIISTCVKLKRDIVAIDEFEQNQRKLLNFGHTLGHSIEKLSNFEIPHGQAVAIGMHQISQIFHPDIAEKLAIILQKYDIDYSCAYSLDELWKETKSDKKRSGSSITLVLVGEIGKGYLKSFVTP